MELHLAALLSAGFEVAVVGGGAPPASPPRPGVRVYAVPLGRLAAATSFAKALFQGDALQCAFFAGDWARQIERAGSVDLCVVVLTRLLPFLRGVLPPCPVVVDYIDALAAAGKLAANEDPAIWRRLYWRFESPRLARAEREMKSLAAVTLATTPRDVEALPAGTQAIPNGVEIRPIDLDGKRAPRVAFTGRLRYRPNEIACRRLVEEIWPGVRSAQPDAELLLAGADAPSWLADLDGTNGIRVESPSPDIGQVLRGSLVAVAPLPSGMGTPNKVFEAFEAGCAVVGTPDLAERSRTDGVVPPVLVAGSNPEFTGAIVRLLGDPEAARRAGREGREFVERHASRDRVLARLSELYSLALDRR